MYLPEEQAFTAVLERKINQGDEKKNRVIPLVIQSKEGNGPEASIFLKEVLGRLSPDILLFYDDLAPLEGANPFEKVLKEDLALYNRAKDIVEKNSSWVKTDRLLYAALEFRTPIKEAVYLYCLLCKSYLFMAIENARKRVLNEWYAISGANSADKTLPVEGPKALFEEVLELCRTKNIKVVFIPQLHFTKQGNFSWTEEILSTILKKHPETVSLNLEGMLSRQGGSPLAIDDSHLTQYGSQVVAEEIFRQLTEKGLLRVKEGL